jgi:1A family penicillin-binding protein
MRRFLSSSLQVILSTVFVSLLLVFFVICFGIGVAGGFMLGCWEDVVALDLANLNYKVDKQTWRQHLEVYSSICEVQLKDSAVFLIDKLQPHRLDYEEIKPGGKGINSPGQYFLQLSGKKGEQNGTIHVFLHEFEYPYMETDTKAKRIYLSVRKGKIESIQNDEGNSIRNFFLEPELIAEFSGDDGGTTRKIIPLGEMPRKLVDAFIAIEDRRFYQHFGIDIIRLGGAIKDALRGGERISGTSTLTQQLTRNIYLESEKYERTLARKFREILLAFRIEKSLSKSQILEAYLNYIDLGRFGGQQLFGVQKAAKEFFGKEVSELEFHECALLAGLPKAPSKLSPVNPLTRENSIKRRNVVLKAMYDQGLLTFEEYNYSRNQPLKVQEPSNTSVKLKRETAGHFIDYIKFELNKIPELQSRLYKDGLKVYTTIDMSMQSVGMDAVADHLRYLDRKYGKHLPNYDANKDNPHGIHPKNNYLQAALIAFEPRTGHVKAMVGGRDYRIDGTNRHIANMNNYNFLNRAIGKSKRQPGSAFKPIVFAALMQEPALITPAKIIVDEPWTIEHVPGQWWSPSNYIEGKHYGPITVRQILAKSINVPTAKAAWETPDTADGYKEGVVRTVELSKRMGISTSMDPAKPSLTLGAFGMTVLELTSAYGIFANRGIKVEPSYIEYITDQEGVPIYPPKDYQPDRTRILDERVAYQITSLLESVIKEGTGGRALRDPFYITRPIAGKTGTTNDNVDAWFVGYTTDLIVGVWVGLDKQGRNIKNYNEQGAWTALPIWARFIDDAARGPEKDFPVPEGIEFWEIDKTTGLLKNKDMCPPENISNEPFINGQEPTKICDQH